MARHQHDDLDEPSYNGEASGCPTLSKGDRNYVMVLNYLTVFIGATLIIVRWWVCVEVRLFGDVIKKEF